MRRWHFGIFSAINFCASVWLPLGDYLASSWPNQLSFHRRSQRISCRSFFLRCVILASVLNDRLFPPFRLQVLFLPWPFIYLSFPFFRDAHVTSLFVSFLCNSLVLLCWSNDRPPSVGYFCRGRVSLGAGRPRES